MDILFVELLICFGRNPIRDSSLTNVDAFDRDLYVGFFLNQEGVFTSFGRDPCMGLLIRLLQMVACILVHTLGCVESPQLWSEVCTGKPIRPPKVPLPIFP